MQFMHHLECAITFDHACATARYDEGCTAITNIDFSKPVIKEMMAKNLRKRPLMKWQVMDMTQTKVRVLGQLKQLTQAVLSCSTPSACIANLHLPFIHQFVGYQNSAGE